MDIIRKTSLINTMRRPLPFSWPGVPTFTETEDKLEEGDTETNEVCRDEMRGKMSESG